MPELAFNGYQIMRQFISRGILAAFFALVIAAGSMSEARADENALFAEAVTLYRGDETTPDELDAIRALLDRIVAEFPSSDLAVKVLMQETVDGVDIAAVDARIAALRQAKRAEPAPPEIPASNA